MNAAWIEEVVSVLIDLCLRAANEDVSSEWSALVKRIEGHVAESGLQHLGLVWAMLIQKAVATPADLSPHLAVLALDNGLIHAVSERVNALSQPTVDAILSRFSDHFDSRLAAEDASRPAPDGSTHGFLRSLDIVSVIPTWLRSVHSQQVLAWAHQIGAFVHGNPAVLLTDNDETVRCCAAIGLLGIVMDQQTAHGGRVDALRSLMRSEFAEMALSRCVLSADLLRSVFADGDSLTKRWAFLLVRQPAVLATPEWVAALAPLLSPTDLAGLPVRAFEKLNVPARLELAAAYLDTYVLTSEQAISDLFAAYEFHKNAPSSLLTEARFRTMVDFVEDLDLKFFLIDQLDARFSEVE